MSHVLENLIRHYGLLAVFVAMVLESACIPLPSELIMTYAGYEAYKGNMNFAAAVTLGVLGNLTGSLLAYYVGRRGGRAAVIRYGSYILLSERHLTSAERFFARYGAPTVLLSRILPAIRTFISLPAGMARMPSAKFVLYTVIGSIPWVYLLTFFGYKLGQNWSAIAKHFTLATGIAALALVVIVIWFWKSNREGKRA